ncbi:glycosyltransferase [Alcanivorax jadensis]|uniref:glycosyltransferase n=1 Tax=Alcanivorax jadensis TaxID=64988 RepID=UPI00240A9193|nr:glycosyltransferase [Alcanivorax jadensis]MDF1637584.1 glycosyltransferase [Alcanivorax jadensis]
MNGQENDRPLVTLALFSYNQQRYVKEAVEAALNQDYEPLEIILSDDCSTDKTFELIKECASNYSGPHEVVVRKNKENMGVALHFDFLMREAKGGLVVIAAGDDVSLPYRVSALVGVYLSDQNVGVIESSCQNFKAGDEFDDVGLKPRELSKIKLEDVLTRRSMPLIGAGRCYVKRRFNRFPPLNKNCPEEDTPALFRCLHDCDGIYTSQTLVRRRIHESNLSSASGLSSYKFEDLHSQYVDDLEWSLGEGVVSSNYYFKISRQLKSYMHTKQLRVDAASGFKMGLGPLDILRDELLPFRDKISYLLIWIKSKF